MDRNGVWAILIAIILIIILARFVPDEARSGCGCLFVLVAAAVIVGLVILL